MTVLWSILSTIGLTVAVWYVSCILDPYGRSNYPRLLRKNFGHVISWVLVITGIVSLVGLYLSTHNLALFLVVLAIVLTIAIATKTLYTSLEMPFNDVMGAIYSEGGLRFGGFQTSDFLQATALLEERQPGIRERVIGEAHYLVFWLHRFPEIAFFFGIILLRSLWLALLLFIVAFIFEIIRFYILGPSLFLSHLSRLWNWVKIPTFIIAAVVLWISSEGIFLSVTLLAFLVIQGCLGWGSVIVLFPMKAVIGRLLYRRHSRRGIHLANIEGMALSFVINVWRLKSLPADMLNDSDSQENKIA